MESRSSRNNNNAHLLSGSIEQVRPPFLTLRCAKYGVNASHIDQGRHSGAFGPECPLAQKRPFPRIAAFSFLHAKNITMPSLALFKISMVSPPMFYNALECLCFVGMISLFIWSIVAIEIPGGNVI